MKTNKLLSLLTAAAISVSSFAALTITVSADTTGNVWISEGDVSVNTVLIDNADVQAKITTFDAKAGSSGAYDGVDYTTSTNLRIDLGKNGGVLEITPAKNGTLTLIYRRQADSNTETPGSVTPGNGKDVQVMDGSTRLDSTSYGTNGTTSYDNTDPSLVTYQAVKATYNIEANKTYQIYGKGTTIQLYKFEFAPATPATEPSAPDDPATEWTNLDGADAATSATKNTAGEYTLSYPASVNGKGFSYPLTIANAPADLTTADGIVTVSMEMYQPKDNCAKDNQFIDISGNTDVRTWGGGNAATYGRLSPYISQYVRYVGGQAATNDSTVYTNNLPSFDAWVPVTFELNYAAKSVTISYNGDKKIVPGFATDITNSLYLNVGLSQSTADHEVKAMFRNITATYTEKLKPEIKKILTDKDDAEDPAVGFTATFTINGSMGVTGCEWTASAGDANGTKNSTLENTTTITDGSVVFGLVVTIPKDKEAQIDSVTADAVLY